MTAAHLDTLTIQDHLRAGRVAIATEMIEDAVCAEFNLMPGTSLRIDLERFVFAVKKIDRTAVNYFLGRSGHRKPIAALATKPEPEAKKWWKR